MNSRIDKRVEEVLEAVGHRALVGAAVGRQRVVEGVVSVPRLAQVEQPGEDEPQRGGGEAGDGERIALEPHHVVDQCDRRRVLVQLEQPKHT
eukprot:6213220-Pleurochrysis_carterae.AAC.8